MTIKDFIERTQKFKDSIGLLQFEDDGRISQNGVLTTAELMTFYYQLLGRDIELHDRLLVLRELDLLNYALNRCIVNGMLIRHPTIVEYDSMDNHIAVLAAKHLYGDESFALEMQRIGKKGVKYIDETDTDPRTKKFFTLAKVLGLGRARNCFNNINPKKFCYFGWYGRSPGLLGFMDICATGKTSWFREFGLFVGQLLTWRTPREDADMRKLPYLVWQVVKDRGPIWRFTHKIWMDRLNNEWEGGIVGMYKHYYSNPRMPLKFLEEVK